MRIIVLLFLFFLVPISTLFGFDQMHVNKLLEGRDAWNHWRTLNPSIEPNLSGYTLSDLEKVQISEGQNGGSYFAFDLRGYNFSKTSLTSIEWVDINITGADFSSANIDYSNIKTIGKNIKVKFASVLFQFSKLSGLFYDADFSNASMNSISIDDSKFINCRFDYAKLDSAYISNTAFSHCSFQNVILSDSTSIRVNYNDAKFINADLSRANLIEANTLDADFTDANLQDAKIHRNQTNSTMNLTGAILSTKQDEQYLNEVPPNNKSTIIHGVIQGSVILGLSGSTALWTIGQKNADSSLRKLGIGINATFFTLGFLSIAVIPFTSNNRIDVALYVPMALTSILTTGIVMHVLGRRIDDKPMKVLGVSTWATGTTILLSMSIGILIGVFVANADDLSPEEYYKRNKFKVDNQFNIYPVAGTDYWGLGLTARF
jgi:uncharacterized protein YjbI with pentapeptide repeats